MCLVIGYMLYWCVWEIVVDVFLCCAVVGCFLDVCCVVIFFVVGERCVDVIGVGWVDCY